MLAAPRAEAPLEAARARARLALNCDAVTDPLVLQAIAESARALHGGKLDDARRGFRSLTEAHPEERAAWSGLGRAAHALGDLREAASAWQRLSALEPSSWQTLNDLGSVWTEMRDFERAAAAFSEAEALNPNEPLLQLNHATLDLRRGELEAAIARLEGVVRRAPDSATAQASLGLALRDAGRAKDAILPLERAAMLSPNTALYACGLGRALLESGNAERALGVAEAYLQRKPGHSGARALEALCRLALGDEPGATRLLDYPRLVAVSTLQAPAEFGDLAAFNAALADHALHHPSLLDSPMSHATTRGLHSGSLLVEPRGPIQALVNAVSLAASAYAKQLGESHPAQPVAKYRPRAVFLRMWCVVLERGGHQIPHIHPEAWLSGVYYPQLPADMSRANANAVDRATPGALEFGAPDAPFPSRMTPPIFVVEPEAGRLVLFPSYFYHRTLPFEAAGTRVSIAFDVVPLQ